MSIISKGLLALALGFTLTLGLNALRAEGVFNPGSRGVFEVEGPVNLNSNSVAPLSNLRITNVPDFRVTNTGDNRAVSP